MSIISEKILEKKEEVRENVRKYCDTAQAENGDTCYERCCGRWGRDAGPLTGGPGGQAARGRRGGGLPEAVAVRVQVELKSS